MRLYGEVGGEGAPILLIHPSGSTGADLGSRADHAPMSLAYCRYVFGSPRELSPRLRT
jgi:hypothetical protein